MEERYYSILEFAELVNVSVQSIYKRLKREDNIIHKYVFGRNTMTRSDLIKIICQKKQY
jgi:predicted DNA-binding protein YlxM (UPF0122 family)